MYGKKNGVKPNNSQSILESSSAAWKRNDSSRRGSAFSSGVGKGSPRIDTEILLDTQSNGLSSRIVKYYEESQKMTRTPRTIYNRPGQFPIVHLKKNEISYSPKRNNSLSVMKIAPPDKSVSDRNLRLNILRQGLSTPSSTPSNDYLEPRKYDNEPLTPSEDIESTPTRSVLDALTEISRKRIHNDEFNGDRTKKQCKDTTEVDGPQPGELTGGQVKRQRDKISPPSPETLTPVESSKKKICRDSHDILSSLSSSVRLLNPKRRIEDVISGDAKRTHYQRPQATVEPKKRSPVASVEPQRRPDLPSSHRVAQLEITPVNVLPPRPPKPTPKVTLFNQNYDKIQDRVLSDTDDDEERRSMNLVRPKQSSQLLVKDKEASKKGTKSKLAMMLSYLSRNFDEDSDDVVDSKEKAKEEKKEEPTPVPSAEQKTPESSKTTSVISFATPTTTSAPVLLNTPTVTLPKPAEEVKEKEALTPPFKFGVPTAKTDASDKAVMVSVVPIAVAPTIADEPKIKEVDEPGKNLLETPAPLQFKPLITTSLPAAIISAAPAPAATSSLSFTAPKAPIFGSSFTSVSQPASMNTQVTPVTSVTTVVSSSAFSGPFGGSSINFGGTSEATKLSTTFTMTPGIAGSTPAAVSSAKTPSFPGGKLDFGFAAQPAASFSTASTTPSSTSSLFTFKPIATTASAPVATSAPVFAFGAPTSQAMIPSTDSNFVYPRNPENIADPSIKPTLIAREYTTPKSMILFGGNSPKMPPAFPTSTNNTTPATSGGFSTSSFTGFSGSTPATSPPAYEAPKTSTDTKALFTFGATTTTQNQTSQGSPFVFSSPQVKPAATTTSTPFAFEKKATPFDAPAATTNVFGTHNQTIFGSAAPSTVAGTNPVFGASASVPVFGAAATTVSATNTTNAFGTGNSVFSGGSPFGGNFGGFGTPTNTNQPIKPITTNSSASPFGFGAENKTVVAATPTPGIFGGSQVATNSFGGAEKPFNFSGSAQAAPFQFGGATSTAGSAPFAFSTPNTAAQTPFGGAPANSFAFGQTEAPKPPPPAYGSNVAVFGGGAQQNMGNAPPAFGATNSAPAFNFSASNPGQQQPFAFGAANPQAGAPMFSIGSNGGTTPQRRPYRHATRRLK